VERAATVTGDGCGTRSERTGAGLALATFGRGGSAAGSGELRRVARAVPIVTGLSVSVSARSAVMLRCRWASAAASVNAATVSTSISPEGPNRALDLLIGIALDDLEQGNLDVETALRLVAHRAWDQGYRAGDANLADDYPQVQDKGDGTRAG
jgi:hypothetical protein